MLDEQEFKDLVAGLDRTGHWPHAPATRCPELPHATSDVERPRTVTQGTVISCADPQAAAAT